MAGHLNGLQERSRSMGPVKVIREAPQMVCYLPYLLAKIILHGFS